MNPARPKRGLKAKTPGINQPSSPGAAFSTVPSSQMTMTIQGVCMGMRPAVSAGETYAGNGISFSPSGVNRTGTSGLETTASKCCFVSFAHKRQACQATCSGGYVGRRGEASGVERYATKRLHLSPELAAGFDIVTRICTAGCPPHTPEHARRERG